MIDVADKEDDRMKLVLWAWTMFWICGNAGAADSVSVPWVEFEKLYRESVERAVMKKVKEDSPVVKKPGYSIHEVSRDTASMNCPGIQHL